MGPREFHDFIPGTVIRFSYLFNLHLLEGLSAGPCGYRGLGGSGQTIPGYLGHTPKTQLCSRDPGYQDLTQVWVHTGITLTTLLPSWPPSPYH